MEEIKLSVTTRNEAGRRPSKRLRKAGSIPAVIYGRSGNRSLAVEQSNFSKVWKKAGHSSIVSITDDTGKETMTLIQNIQRHPLTDQFLHVDFLELTKDHAITANIPLHVEGESIGVKNENGLLELPSHEVEVRCLPKDLPHQIDIDVSELHVGDVIHLSDLPKLEGVEYLGDPDQPIVSIGLQKLEDEPEETEEVEAGDVPATKVSDDEDDSSDEKDSKESKDS